MNAKQRRTLNAVLLLTISASAGLWMWYAHEKDKVEAEGQRQIHEAAQTVQDCSKQMPSRNLSVKCQEFLGRK